MRTILFVTLVVIAGGFFDSLMFAAGYDALSEFDGREVVVQIYRMKPEGGSSAENKTIQIKDGTFRLSEDDIAGSYGIEVPSSLQKDPLVKQQVGRDSCSYRPWEGPVFHLPVRQDELEGRQVVVRVYENWQTDPVAYRQMSVPTRKGVVTFDFADVNGSAFVAVFGQDQNDDLIKKVLGLRIYGWDYAKGLKYALPLKVAPHKQQDFQWTFLDALGDPVPNAQVQIYMGYYDESTIWIGSTETDKDGVAGLPFCKGTGEVTIRVGKVGYGCDSSPLRFVVSHPDYGQSVVVVRPDTWKEPVQSVLIPAVPAGSEADQRSVWGVVLDEQKNPLPGLHVRSSCFYPMGGKRIDVARGQNCGVITDAKGRFRIYLPPDEDSLKIGWLIPPRSEYAVGIDPQKNLGLLPFSARIPNGQETIITLERSGQFHTFVFEDANGPIEDNDRLSKILINIKRPEKKPGLHVTYDDFRDGGIFPPGKYLAKRSLGTDTPFEPIDRFESIEVTSESPEKLVFKISPERTHYGRVVNGITGQPVEKAFVIDMFARNSGRNLAMLTDAQWQQLNDIDRTLSRFNKEFSETCNAVDSCYSFTQITTTDANGWFEMTPGTGRNFYKLVVFAKNYLTVIIDDDDFETQTDNRVKVPQTKLFGAAKVIVQAWAQDSYDRIRPKVWPECIIDKQNNPSWVDDFLTGWDADGSTFMEDIRNDFCVDLNKQACFPVPAGLNLTLQLRPRYGDIEENWASLTVARNINLQQGQVLNLGRHQIPRPVPLFVSVLNSSEQAVEGVPVNAFDQYGRQTSNTDENGTVIFELAPDAKGRFVVEYDADNDSSTDDLREHKPYEITGPEDANTVYTLRVPDELLYNLFK